jgi:hypothetical protein
MKLTKQPSFSPVTITLETPTEMSIFWDMVNSSKQACGPDEQAMADELSDWLQNEANM